MAKCVHVQIETEFVRESDDEESNAKLLDAVCARLSKVKFNQGETGFFSCDVCNSWTIDNQFLPKTRRPSGKRKKIQSKRKKK